MSEEEGNIEFVCSSCTGEQIQKFNENLPDINPGDFVKASFPTGMDPQEGVPAESMWVEVLEFKGDQITGILSNVPAFIPASVNYYKQEVKVMLSQCMDYLEKK